MFLQNTFWLAELQKCDLITPFPLYTCKPAFDLNPRFITLWPKPILLYPTSTQYYWHDLPSHSMVTVLLSSDFYQNLPKSSFLQTWFQRISVWQTCWNNWKAGGVGVEGCSAEIVPHSEIVCVCVWFPRDSLSKLKNLELAPPPPGGGGRGNQRLSPKISL